MNEPRVPTIRKFNPGLLQSDCDVIEQFVVRHRVLDVVLDVLRGNVEAPSCQHVLIVAPRGRGKTMLLARAAAELRVDKELSTRLLPVRFMEESHEIFGLADFWLEALFHLAREAADIAPDLSRELRDTHADLKSRWRERELADRARAAVLTAAERLDRRLVLMVENLQALGESVDDDFGWGLRQALQSEPRIMLVATATSRFEGLDDARQPFFELFRTISLRPLDTEDCRRLWRAAGGGDRSAWNIRPLEILTGGSPRLLVIVAGFARHRSLRQLMDELVTLIDDHTEYFRGHLEGLPRTERRVYLAAIDFWHSASPGEIAARAALDVRVVSTMLGRLVERGAVAVEGSGRKRRYAAAERLYCIYYKLRRERGEAAVVQGLIRFMAVFYDREELAEMSDTLRMEAARFPAFREGIERALAGMPDTEADAFTGAVFREEGQRPIDGEDGQAREGVDEALELRLSVASKLTDKGVTQWRRGDAKAATATWGAIIERFGADEAPELRLHVVRALIAKGAAQGLLGDTAAAVATCNEVIERFGADKTSELRSQVAVALVNKSLAQNQLGNTEAAVATCDEIVERFGTDEAPELRSQVAVALVNKSLAQERHGDTEGAIATWDEIVERFGADEAPELRSQVAMALVNKGLVQEQLDDVATAIDIWDEVVDRFGVDETPELRLRVAAALVHKGLAQGRHGDTAAAVTTCDEVVDRFGIDEVSELRSQVAWALLNKSLIQTAAGHPEDSLRVCEDLERRLCTLSPDKALAFRWRTAWARIKALLSLGRQGAAVDAFRAAYALFIPENEEMMGEMLGSVPETIAAGFPEHDLVAVLAEDREKAAALAPLLVALRQRAGESVRAPAEVLEVAEDIRRRIDETGTAESVTPVS